MDGKPATDITAPRTEAGECPTCHGPVTIKYCPRESHGIVGWERWTDIAYEAAPSDAALRAALDGIGSLWRVHIERYGEGYNAIAVGRLGGPVQQGYGEGDTPQDAMLVALEAGPTHGRIASCSRGALTPRRHSARSARTRPAIHFTEGTSVTEDPRSRTVPRTDLVWLIERGQARHQEPPIWWAGVGDLPSHPDIWTNNAWSAVRFPSRESAAAMIEVLRLRRQPIGDPVEHGFIEAEATEPRDPSALLPSYIDRERLARAMTTVYQEDLFFQRGDDWRIDADAIAAEYNLAPPSRTRSRKESRSD